jgi:hypothetical protein
MEHSKEWWPSIRMAGSLHRVFSCVPMAACLGTAGFLCSRSLLGVTTRAGLPDCPGHGIDHGPDKDESTTASQQLPGDSWMLKLMLSADKNS